MRVIREELPPGVRMTLNEYTLEDESMGAITRRTRSDLKQLPLMLCKVLGGIAAVIGVMTAVLVMTRSSGASPGNIVPPLLIGGAGMALFILSGRALSRRSSIAPQESARADRLRMNALSWALLLLFAGIFVAIAWFTTG